MQPNRADGLRVGPIECLCLTLCPAVLQTVEYTCRSYVTSIAAVLQEHGIEEAAAAEQHKQAAVAAAVQLPWLGPILQTALVPMQVRLSQKACQLKLYCRL